MRGCEGLGHTQFRKCETIFPLISPLRGQPEFIGDELVDFAKHSRFLPHFAGRSLTFVQRLMRCTALHDNIEAGSFAQSAAQMQGFFPMSMGEEAVTQ